MYAPYFAYDTAGASSTSWDAEPGSCCQAVVSSMIDVFRSPRGAVIALRNAMPVGDGAVLYSEDGQTFREMAGRGFAGSEEQYKLTFEDPSDRRQYELRRDHDVLRLGREKFYRAPKVWDSELHVLPLPPVRQPEYMFAVPDGTFLYVSDTVYRPSYDFWFFVGAPPVLSRVFVRDVKRARDGGTTVVETDAGVLYVPTPWHPELRPMWNGTPIRKVDPSRFRIDESPVAATVRRR